jgi:hypothetical protein
MERKRIVCLFLFAVLILVFSSCHPRHVTDIRPNMTKDESLIHQCWNLQIRLLSLSSNIFLRREVNLGS